MIRKHEFGRSSGSSPAAKRQKIAVACDACRIRKIRCDGKEPVCTQCVSGRKLHTCTYGRKPPEVQRENLQDLESSLVQDDTLRSTRESADAMSTAQTRLNGIAAAYTGPSRPNIASDKPQNVVFGESPSTTFSNRLSRHPEHPQQGFNFIETNRVPFKLGGSAEKAGVLPRRRIADEIVDDYWKFVHPLFPILHRPTFMAAYEKSWMSQPSQGTKADEGRREFEEALFFSTLNIMFALGTRFCDSVAAADKSDMVKEFYNRSRQVFTFDVLDHTFMPVLQMVLLQGVYLQSTTEVSRCWNVIGVAIRMAQSLGLHSEKTYQRQKTQYTREMGRRLWHSCLVLDRLAAATFGWPMMIQGQNSIPLPVLDDNAMSLQGEVFVPVTPTSAIQTFRYTCKLFGIVEDVVSTLYHNNGSLLPASVDRCQHSQILLQVMGLNGRLEAYLISLPILIRDFIDGCEHTNPDGAWKPLLATQHAISCRFLYTRILLLRPALRTPLDKSDLTEEGDEQITMHAINICVKASHRLLDILYTSVDSSLYIADWHVVYMTFTAATSLLAIKKSASMPLFELHEPLVDSLLRVSRHILQNMSQRVLVSVRAVRFLNTLENQIALQNARPQRIAEATVVPSVEQDLDDHPLESFGDLDDFDWLVNPSALLSRQSPGLDMSWLEGADSWLS
ncbi:unnamed protein product, partial [Aureobasidium vineae]